jgi:ferredoxin-NADP reductase
MSVTAPQIEVRVAEIIQVTPRIKRFRFERTDGEPFPSFSGGAHVVVEINDGETLRRNPYSLMSDPRHTTSYVISVLRHEAGRGGSIFMHDRISENAIVKISYPVNLFPPAFHAAKHLLIAGGIGITPFLAMMDQIQSEHRAFELHYAARSSRDAAYAGEIAARFGRCVHLYFSESGRRLAIGDVLAHQPLGTHLYVCGPERLIREVVVLATSGGWPRSNIHLERFVAPAVGLPYRVELAKSGKTISVGATQSMLEAIEAAGVNPSYLCRGGACGQCETAVVECDGTLMHADHFLNEAEKASGRKVMPCVSRFQGRRLVLDL